MLLWLFLLLFKKAKLLKLCIAPLLLLLLNTAKDVKDHQELVSSLCFQVAVDLFDAVEIIDIVLERQNGSYGCHGNPKSQGLGDGRCEFFNIKNGHGLRLKQVAENVEVV